MSKKIGMIYFLICFSFAILVFIPMFKDSGFGFLQTSNTLNSTNATAANSTNATAANSTNATAANSTNATAANSTNATAANSTNATAANSTQISKPVQITSSNTKASTNGTSVDIDLQIKPFPVIKNVDTQFMITFLQPSTQSVQVHVDYDFAISKMNKEVFRASSKTGQPLLHTAEGIVKIPYKFDQEGQYSLQISVMGINFIPIKTEQALFDLKVS
jgi:cell wall-associated NlpC family hydrolase